MDLWTSPSDRREPCGPCGQPLGNAKALPRGCPHFRASRPRTPQHQPQDFDEAREDEDRSIWQHMMDSRFHLDLAANLSKDWGPPLFSISTLNIASSCDCHKRHQNAFSPMPPITDPNQEWLDQVADLPLPQQASFPQASVATLAQFKARHRYRTVLLIGNYIPKCRRGRELRKEVNVRVGEGEGLAPPQSCWDGRAK